MIDYTIYDCEINDNLIDRSELISRLKNGMNSMDVVLEILKMPAVKEKRGHWNENFRHNDCFVCSECLAGVNPNSMAYLNCNRESDERESGAPLYNLLHYCPNCGAKMNWLE